MLVKQPKFRSLMGWGVCVWKRVLIVYMVRGSENDSLFPFFLEFFF